MKQQTAIITGGTGGLGAAVVQRFLGDGWEVVVPWVQERELERVGEHERLTLVQADLFDPDAAREVAAAAGEGLGAVVNLVGGFAAGERMHETDPSVLDDQLRLNLRPAWLLTAATALIVWRTKIHLLWLLGAGALLGWLGFL